MEIEKKEYNIKGTTKCECGHNFNMLDFTELKRLNIQGFYGNQLKHYSPCKCPSCHKETLLLLKQVGQTYAVIDIATLIKKQEEEIENQQDFICTKCKKVCKNQLGLKAHMRAHQK